jgi:hypothetical protein
MKREEREDWEKGGNDTGRQTQGVHGLMTDEIIASSKWKLS